MIPPLPERLRELADLIDETAAEAEAWARQNTEAYAQEIFIAQVAVNGTLKLLSSKLRARAQSPLGDREG